MNGDSNQREKQAGPELAPGKIWHHGHKGNGNRPLAQIGEPVDAKRAQEQHQAYPAVELLVVPETVVEAKGLQRPPEAKIKREMATREGNELGDEYKPNFQVAAQERAIGLQLLEIGEIHAVVVACVVAQSREKCSSAEPRKAQ